MVDEKRRGTRAILSKRMPGTGIRVGGRAKTATKLARVPISRTHKATRKPLTGARHKPIFTKVSTAGRPAGVRGGAKLHRTTGFKKGTTTSKPRAVGFK